MADSTPLKKSELRAAIWDKTNGRCWYCGKQTNPWRDFTIDHVIPGSNGGDEAYSNLVPCCKSCNSKKLAGTVEDLRRRYQRDSGTLFSLEQRDYLASHGIELPDEKFLFYFEQQELE